ncbi:GIY-YIG nuclease family protein [Candidatus Babeliales bacterium]|nr:GIY-YIG nuclease family protein [Candidatus Babeliales bacterium]
MIYVYILRSLSNPEQTYVGFTRNLSDRLKRHNAGVCTYTSKYIPWNVVTYTAFADLDLAIEFEKYLKTSSGKKFMSQRLVKKEIL